jgi:hypothetical protein
MRYYGGGSETTAHGIQRALATNMLHTAQREFGDKTSNTTAEEGGGAVARHIAQPVWEVDEVLKGWKAVEVYVVGVWLRPSLESWTYRLFR